MKKHKQINTYPEQMLDTQYDVQILGRVINILHHVLWREDETGQFNSEAYGVMWAIEDELESLRVPPSLPNKI